MYVGEHVTSRPGHGRRVILIAGLVALVLLALVLGVLLFASIEPVGPEGTAAALSLGA